MSYGKLMSSIVTSSVWVEDDATLRVWIAMLATADATGRVDGSVPGFANLARVSVQQMQAALAKFLAPDQHSRTKDHEGRRIREVDGGWLLLNYAKHREDRDGDERREQVRAAVARYRKRKHDSDYSNQGKPRKAQAEAEAKSEPIPRAVRARTIRQPHAWHQDARFKALIQGWPTNRRGNRDEAFACWEGQGEDGKARIEATVRETLAECPAEKLGAFSQTVCDAIRAPYAPPANGTGRTEPCDYCGKPFSVDHGESTIHRRTCKVPQKATAPA